VAPGGKPAPRATMRGLSVAQRPRAGSRVRAGAVSAARRLLDQRACNCLPPPPVLGKAGREAAVEDTVKAARASGGPVLGLPGPIGGCNSSAAVTVNRVPSGV